METDQLSELTLGKAAKIARYEPKYFSSFFRKKVGVTFVVWRTCLRVSKAKELIMSCDHSLAYVCAAAGFADMRTFQRAFKKYTGESPREYKQTRCGVFQKGTLPKTSRKMPHKSRKTPQTLIKEEV